MIEARVISPEAPAQRRQMSLLVRNLCPGLTERGKIKIGEKGREITSRAGKTFQPPTKLDHFRVTTLARGVDGNYVTDSEIHRLHGEKPRELPVRLLYDEIELNFQSRYVCFKGKTMWCAGDGEWAQRIVDAQGTRQEVECPCQRQDPTYTGEDRCKINGTLSLIIEGAEAVGGVWKLRTTSYNSVVGITSSLALIKSITGGPLAGIPLWLTLNPKTVIVPTSGQVMTVWVVGLEYRGKVEQLEQIGYGQAARRAKHLVSIERVEEQARRLIAHDPLRMDDVDPTETVEEFYPEQAVAEAKAAPVVPATETPAPVTPAGNGAAPTSQADTEETFRVPGNPNAPRRSRRTRFTLADGTEIQTCGITPEQMAVLQAAARESDCKSLVMDALHGVGYDRLSFLREDEAEALMRKVQMVLDAQGGAQSAPETPPEPAAPTASPEAPPFDDLPDDLVSCPMEQGEKRSVSRWCTVSCQTRKRDGFCPVVDSLPAAAGFPG